MTIIVSFFYANVFLDGYVKVYTYKELAKVEDLKEPIKVEDLDIGMTDA